MEEDASLVLATLDRRDTEENPFNGGIALWPVTEAGGRPGRSKLVEGVFRCPPHHAPLPCRRRLATL